MIRTVPIESIESPLLCIPNSPDEKFFDVQHASFVTLCPQNEWCFAWISWNEVLLEQNGPIINYSDL